jgi:ribosomal protein S18 acetylase RimI-like enzyme
MASPPVVRWFIFACGSGTPVKGQSLDGFASESEAHEFHRSVFRSDPRLEVRCVSGTDEAVLDNPIYYALTGAHSGFAQTGGRVLRYSPDVAPFLGLPSSPTPQDWRDAAALLGPGGYAAVRCVADDLPEGWSAGPAFDLVQMVEDRVQGAAYPEAVPLGSEDVPEMLELVAATEPGPFLRRTIELGDYIGVRSEGTLVAMAGERFRPEGWTEISAVCTRPEQRGRGLASHLVGALVASIQRRSERSFLHVLSTNTSAIRLYEQLGFNVRQTATITIAIPPGRDEAEGRGE